MTLYVQTAGKRIMCRKEKVKSEVHLINRETKKQSTRKRKPEVKEGSSVFTRNRKASVFVRRRQVDCCMYTEPLISPEG